VDEVVVWKDLEFPLILAVAVNWHLQRFYGLVSKASNAHILDNDSVSWNTIFVMLISSYPVSSVIEKHGLLRLCCVGCI